MAAVLVLLLPLSCGEFQFDYVVQAACTGLHVQYVAFGGCVVKIKLRRIVERGDDLVGKILRLGGIMQLQAAADFQVRPVVTVIAAQSPLRARIVCGDGAAAKQDAV